MFLTFVYMSPPCSIKKCLWSQLEEVPKSVGDMPWALARDFNYRLFTDDRIGGVRLAVNPLKDFRKWFSRNILIDLGFQGPKFTWRRGDLFKQID